MKFVPLWLFLLALGIRLLLIAVTQLDGLYGQDAFAYFGCARQILDAHAGEIPCSSLYWPLGFPALAALFMLGSHGSPFGAQLASVVTGSAIAPLAYWLVLESGVAQHAPREESRRSGIAAGLLLAFCGALLMSSILIMSDAPGLFWATLSACLLLRWERAAHPRGQSLWLTLAALALVLAIVTRWIFGGLLVPFGAFVVHSLVRRMRAVHATGALVPQGFMAGTVVSLGLAATVFLLILLPQLYINQHSGAPVVSHGWVVNWNPLHAVHRSFDNPDGHFDYRLPPILFYAEPLFHPLFLFPLLTPCVLFGAWSLRRSPLLILLGGWITALYLYLIGIPYENARFGLAFFAPVAVLAGVGLMRMPLPGRLRAAGEADSLRRWLLLAVSLALSIPFAYRDVARFSASRALETAATQYLRSQLPADATVVTFELSVSLPYYTQFRIFDLYDQSPQSLRPVVCGNPSVYLYVQKEKLETQWIHKTPAENFHWLRDRVGLEEIGSNGTWTLYRIRPCNQ